MVIAITSEEPELNSFVAKKFSKAPFIILYNLEASTFEVLRNPYLEFYAGGGIQTAQLIIEKNANILIACDIGLNAYRLLQSANVKIYSCMKLKIKEALKEFSEGKLSSLEQEPRDYSSRIQNNS